MHGIDLRDLSAFKTVVDEGSFAKAAAKLGVSPSAISQTLRTLEKKLGVRLINRTTRSLSPSEAGVDLLARLRPVLVELNEALEAAKATTKEPTGTLRINMLRTTGQHLVSPVLRQFHAVHPHVPVRLILEDALTDIVAGGFDAGIRLGPSLEQDMVAIGLGRPLRLVVVGSPEYLERRGSPADPGQLHDHACLNAVRATDGSLLRWKFNRDGESIEVHVQGPLVTNDAAVLRQAAVDGLGLAYLFDHDVEEELRCGRLIAVLEDWSPPSLRLFLYYPSRQHVRPALRAFIDLLREQDRLSWRENS
jgi:DNA-binding transcriptional LysR family regulator